MGVRFNKFYRQWEWRYKEKKGGWHIGFTNDKESARKAFEFTKHRFETISHNECQGIN